MCTREEHRSVASRTLPIETWPATQACAPARNQTDSHLVCRSVLKPLSHTSRGDYYRNFLTAPSTFNLFHSILRYDPTSQVVTSIPSSKTSQGLHPTYRMKSKLFTIGLRALHYLSVTYLLALSSTSSPPSHPVF